ncbi:MAG: hypothetical protein PHD74_08015 [Candidatus Krumholzibacteria bacterium]|nr:hypothetical protein [Candidatus Krumholzibacteria bacterium]
MNRIEKLILEIRQQLFPYRHEHDVERNCERWLVDEGDYLTSWIIAQLAVCRDKNKCGKKKMCAFYSFSDLARKNFEICQEMILMLEGGEARCSFIGKDEEK